MLNRKELEPEPEPEPELKPEPQSVISAPAPGGNLISAPRLSAPAPQHFFPNSANVLVNGSVNVHYKDRTDNAQDYREIRRFFIDVINLILSLSQKGK